MMHELLRWEVIAGALSAAAVLLQEEVQQPSVPMSVPTSIETLIVIGNAVTTPNPNGKAVVRAWAQLTVGTATTGIVMTIYAGNAIGGRVIGTRTPDAGDFTPGETSYFECEFIDPFSNTSGVQYCMSLQQAGATADGSIVAALIDTKVLSG